MNAHRYQRLRELFGIAREMDSEQRKVFIDQACAGDSAMAADLAWLLADSGRTTAFLEPCHEHPGNGSRRPRSGPVVPGRIGRYQIVRLLGEGGMGIVYEAEQDRPHRRVALKIMRAGSWSPAALRRFKQETEILAMLQHPGIAQIYEVGVAEVKAPGAGEALSKAASDANLHPAGRPVPYFAMELIRGLPLLEHAQQNGLGLREKLQLVARICDAVQHAHQNGVIHRDLKPTNILVAFDRGRNCRKSESAIPKILDFGIARLTGSRAHLTTVHTHAGQIIGTLAYMSPEQMAGDSCNVDTRSDVYSLGVIAYELLCGCLPYDARSSSIPDAISMIREQPPIRPSVIQPGLRGDAETIVLKALEKDRERRYPTAGDLAQDIRRCLNHEPIIARPPTLAYQLRKLIIRHRAVAALAGAFVLALALFGVCMTALYLEVDGERHRAEQAEQAAEAQAATATQVAGSLMDLFASFDPSTASDNPFIGLVLSSSELLDRTAEIINHRLDSQPETQVALLIRLAQVNDARARFAQGEALARNAMRIAQERCGPEHMLVARAMRQVGHALINQDQIEDAQPFFQESLDLILRLPPDACELALALYNSGSIAHQRGHRTRARQLLNESLEALRSGCVSPEISAGMILHRIGHHYLQDHRPKEAQAAFGQAIEAFRPLEQTELHQRWIENCRGAIAAAMRMDGDYTRAEQIQRELIAQHREQQPNVHPRLAGLTRELGQTLMLAGKLEAAEIYLQEAREMYRVSLGENTPQFIESTGHLAALYDFRHDRSTAEQLYRERLRLGRLVWPPDSPPIHELEADLATALIHSGFTSESASILHALIDNRRAKLKLRLRAAGLLMIISTGTGNFDEARAIAAAALQHADGAAVEQAFILVNLGRVYGRLGEWERALEYTRDALRITRDQPDKSSRGLTAAAISQIGQLLWANGNVAAAEEFLREASTLELGTSELQGTVVASLSLGQLLYFRNAPESARILERLHAAHVQRFGPSAAATQSMRYLLVRALQIAGKKQAAEVHLDELWNLQEQHFADGRPHIGGLHNLILALHAQGEFDRAVSLLPRIVALYEQVRHLSNEHPDRSGAAMLLGLLHLGQGGAESAEPLLREAYDLRKLHLRAEHWMTAYAQSLLGECLVDLKRFDEAEPLLLDACETLHHEFFQAPAHRFYEVCQRLVRLYKKWDKPGELDACRATYAGVFPTNIDHGP